MSLSVRIGSIGLLVLGLLVALVVNPENFSRLLLAFFVVVSVGVYSTKAPEMRTSDIFRGLFALSVPAFAALIFIESTFWQYIFAGLVAGLMAYYIAHIAKASHTWGAAGVIIPMVQASLASVMMLGLEVYFNVPWWGGVLGVVLLMALFPGSFRSHARESSQERSMLFSTQVATPHALMWHVIPVNTQSYLHRFVKFSIGSKQLYVLRLKVYAIIALSEVYIVTAMLPISIVVSAAIISLVMACLALLMNYHDYGLMRGVIVKRYVGVCVAMALVMLLTAQLS